MNVLDRSVKEAKGGSTKSKKVEQTNATLASLDAALASVDLDDFAAPAATSVVVQGMLLKKSGGKHRRQHWNKRYFHLPPKSSVLSYYKSEAAYESGKDALGSIEVQGATVFQKEKTKGGTHRFTIASSERELKLRAPNDEEYAKWIAAFKPYAAVFRDLVDGDEEMIILGDEEASSDDEGGLSSLRVASTRDRGASQAAVTVAAAGGGASEGWLEKKQGGKEGRGRAMSSLTPRGLFGKKLGKWEKRYFAIDANGSVVGGGGSGGSGSGGGAALVYYHKADEWLARRSPLDTMDLSSATAFPKEAPKDVAKGRYRFTVKDAHRELKLRTDSAESRRMWLDALTAPGRAKLVNAAAGGADDDDDDDDDDDGPESIS